MCVCVYLRLFILATGCPYGRFYIDNTHVCVSGNIHILNVKLKKLNGEFRDFEIS
jgi:hypothetical protein